MVLKVEGASEHNLKDIDVQFGDGLAVVTGVSGSGKSSLVFDTLYHESRRRLLESLSSSALRLAPAKVRSIEGLGPAIAVGQDLLNRNPNSTLATASGLHPFLRILYARFGRRRCQACGEPVSVLTEDEVVERLAEVGHRGSARIQAPLVRGLKGGHQTLVDLLLKEFESTRVLIDGREAALTTRLDPALVHDIEIVIGEIGPESAAEDIRHQVEMARALGATSLSALWAGRREDLGISPACTRCGAWIHEISPVHFRSRCPHCNGGGCGRCLGTGLHPEAAAVDWQGFHFPGILSLSVHEMRGVFLRNALPSSGSRLQEEIERRLEALERVGLGYVTLDRPSPTLSRGESQRVRLAVSLTGRLEDVLHVLDEPSIGQHPADVARLLPAFRDLGGPVVYVEHDRAAAAVADEAVDLGPGAGAEGGHVIFRGSPSDLWRSDTPTGRYFSLREVVERPKGRPKPSDFLLVNGANLRNLRGMDIRIPIGHLTVITGVSGSGKSTLVEDVLVSSLREGHPIGCRGIEGPRLKPILVDQSPIGRNPRSNPATYTKLSESIREVFSRETGLSSSHFSFNRPEGACPDCKGIGALEVRMRYLPSTWITCSSCNGRRFSDEVLAARVDFGDLKLSIADLYELTIEEVAPLLGRCLASGSQKHRISRLLGAFTDVGLGYLPLGQPSPTLSGGEAQRVKLVKHLGRRSLGRDLLVLDEPSTGLHPQDVGALLVILDRLVRHGATIVVVEHNTDVIRACDWVIDLGPGAGPEGGDVIYAGPPEELTDASKSLTGRCLKGEGEIMPRAAAASPTRTTSSCISVRHARAHNLKSINVDIPKGALTVVTGVSGSGKSSLVGDVIEAEARRRYLECLSMYERQTTHEGPEAPVGAVTGLGVSVAIGPDSRVRGRRATVGTVTELSHHLANIMSLLGDRDCPVCGRRMERRDEFLCPGCGARLPIPAPGRFLSTTYAGACLKCHGMGTVTVARPEKLIVNPDRPICSGAMYSPGFFPRGYICKPYNGGYYMLEALADRYRFDPAETPWQEMSPQAQRAFLFGDREPMEVHYMSRSGRAQTRTQRFPGFYGWVGEWDFGGTYTSQEECPECHGGRIRPEYLAVRLLDRNMADLSTMPLAELGEVLRKASTAGQLSGLGGYSIRSSLRRLETLTRVGLGYLNLERLCMTLSAGEAQRIKLAGLLGGGLTSVTVLVDEPSRGLHPSEVQSLSSVLKGLADQGNTVIVVEHDPVLIRMADNIVDLGTGPGAMGGAIVAQGSPGDVALADTPTGRWLRGEAVVETRRARRKAKGWMVIRGARENNLRGEEVRIPLGVMVGICGVSGSGKSTLIIDTLARVIAPKKQTTSVAHEPIRPGEHDAIEGAPARAMIVDQARQGVSTPLDFLGLRDRLTAIYASSEDAKAMGIGEDVLGRRCSACGGRGTVSADMGFLPKVTAECEVCDGTGLAREVWEVRAHGVTLPEAYSMTIDEILDTFGDDVKSLVALGAAQKVGLGYLVLRQPTHALSGGEAQRLKIAKELCGRPQSDTLYILDEPTVGQHMEDVGRLMGVLQGLVDAGHSVIVIEHQPHLLASCDWLVELGPAGGPQGGHVIASGTPEEIAAGNSPTSAYVREALGG